MGDMADWDIEQGQMAEWMPDDGPQRCPKCHGGGYVESNIATASIKCPACKGCGIDGGLPPSWRGGVK